jgi:hypothetical protein
MLKPKGRTTMLLLLGCVAICIDGGAQTGTATAAPIQVTAPHADRGKDAMPQQPVTVSSRPPVVRGQATEDKPIPDIVAVMHDVETNERKAETIEKNYLYHSVVTEQKVDGHGRIKKTEVTEFDHYWVNGVPVSRKVKKDGKALSAEEIAREDDRIDQEAAKAHERRGKADAQGKETDSRGEQEITVSRLVELGAFTNPRRVQLGGRDTIAVDFAGDPRAKTHNRSEDVIRDMVGTAWIDEQDHVLARVEGRFVSAFKVAGGLVVNIQKDTRFSWDQTKINNEVWLPAHIEGQGTARVLLFFSFNGSLRAVESDYRKFRTSSTILPGVTQVAPPEATDSPARP